MQATKSSIGRLVARYLYWREYGLVTTMTGMIIQRRGVMISGGCNDGQDYRAQFEQLMIDVGTALGRLQPRERLFYCDFALAVQKGPAPAGLCTELEVISAYFKVKERQARAIRGSHDPERRLRKILGIIGLIEWTLDNEIRKLRANRRLAFYERELREDAGEWENDIKALTGLKGRV